VETLGVNEGFSLAFHRGEAVIKSPAVTVRSAGRALRITERVVGDAMPLIELNEATLIQLALQLPAAALHTGFHPG
jgi:hypothetical protein